MAIHVKLDAVLAEMRDDSDELAERIGLTLANVSVLIASQRSTRSAGS